MGKKKLIDRIAERFDGNREVAQHALDAVVDAITKSLAAGEKVVIKRFGVFSQTTEKGKKKSTKRVVPTFDPTDELRDIVAGVQKARDRAMHSLSMVPAQAAQAAEFATRAASSAARAAADAVRSEMAEESKKTAEPRKTAEPKKTAEPAGEAAPATTSTAKKSTPTRKSTAKKTTPAKKSTPTKKTTPAKKSTPAKKTTPPSSPTSG